MTLLTAVLVGTGAPVALLLLFLPLVAIKRLRK